MVTIEEVRRVKEKYQSELMRKFGVIGCGIGYKYVDGKKTNELCIICYVKEKIPKEELEEKDIIPEIIEGILIDIVESGEIRAF